LIQWVDLHKSLSTQRILENMMFFLIQTNRFLHLHACRNPTLAKCGDEAQHLEKVRIWSPPGLPNV
jgi:hypothetical protein